MLQVTEADLKITYQQAGNTNIMYRLFIAIDFPEPVKEKIADIFYGVPHARWTSLDQIHLTIRFIGEVEEYFFEEIKSALYTVHSAKMSIALKGTGYFPLRKEPRVIWIGVEKNELLFQLSSRIERALVTAGCMPEKRKFHPHITIARIKEKVPSQKIMPFISNTALFSIPDIQIDHFSLYSSELTRNGAVHTREESYSLI
ncbi:MAG: RNA 2',3'-cyclic phosphodiesterase [Chitinivibrionales bacterium]|nr:RNA 2',3'-cyclic phosphodiesterase [Chitinivibrionales bacterium]